MKLTINIPKEFEKDFNTDNFNDFFFRVINTYCNGELCGNYEKEIAQMFLKAFNEAIVNE